MPFADGSYWEVNTLNDTIAVVGLFLTLGSIWFSWYLARRDIQNRIEEAADRAARAARDEVRRVAQALASSGVSDAARSLDLAREACKAKRWPRALDLCHLGSEQFSRLLGQPTLDNQTAQEVRQAAVLLVEVIAKLRKQPRQGTGDFPEGFAELFDTMLTTLHTTEARFRGVRSEVEHGQEI